MSETIDNGNNGNTTDRIRLAFGAGSVFDGATFAQLFNTYGGLIKGMTDGEVELPEMQTDNDGFAAGIVGVFVEIEGAPARSIAAAIDRMTGGANG